MSVLLTLGDFRFSVNELDYHELERSTEYRHASTEIFGGDDQLHYTGPGADEITLNGVLYPHFKGREQHLDDLNEMGRSGKQYILTTGRGRVLGKWVILSKRVNETSIMKNGVALKNAFTITLRFAGRMGQ
jgi:phage protein U